jgi:hypothetical protein
VRLDLRDRAHAHDRVAVDVLGDELAAVAEHDLAPRRVAEPEQEPALDLSADQVRVDGDAAVEGEHDPVEADTPAVIDRDLGHVGAVAEEWCASCHPIGTATPFENFKLESTNFQSGVPTITGSAAPVVVKTSTPFVNITSRTNGRFTEVDTATTQRPHRAAGSSIAIP